MSWGFVQAHQLARIAASEGETGDLAFDKTTLLFAIVRLSYIRGKMAIDFWICAWVRFTIGFSGGSCFFAFFAFLPFLLGSFSVLGLSAFLVCFCLFYFLLLCFSVFFRFVRFLCFSALLFVAFSAFLLFFACPSTRWLRIHSHWENACYKSHGPCSRTCFNPKKYDHDQAPPPVKWHGIVLLHISIKDRSHERQSFSHESNHSHQKTLTFFAKKK